MGGEQWGGFPKKKIKEFFPPPPPPPTTVVEIVVHTAILAPLPCDIFFHVSNIT